MDDRCYDGRMRLKSNAWFVEQITARLDDLDCQAGAGADEGGDGKGGVGGASLEWAWGVLTPFNSSTVTRNTWAALSSACAGVLELASPLDLVLMVFSAERPAHDQAELDACDAAAAQLVQAVFGAHADEVASALSDGPWPPGAPDPQLVTVLGMAIVLCLKFDGKQQSQSAACTTALVQHMALSPRQLLCMAQVMLRASGIVRKAWHDQQKAGEGAVRLLRSLLEGGAATADDSGSLLSFCQGSGSGGLVHLMTWWQSASG